jgi:Ca2+-binding EF-hand superfamily protein
MVGAPIEVDLRAVPNLPGYKLPKRITGNQGRTQGFAYVSGVPMMVREQGVPRTDKPKFVRTAKPPDQWKQGTFPESTTREIFKEPVPKDFDELPAWDALDRHVLRFYGYFQEAVTESNMENYRVRRAIIYFYLEDDTMHITEPRIDNAGIPQGTLIRRHRFPSESGGFITPEELSVGADLTIYGKHIRLIDCDKFTRAYYEQQDPPIQQADAQPIPGDNFASNLAGGQKLDPALKRNYEKLYRENMLGGGHINADMQQFMENDRHVCRFFATMDDLMTAQYECRPFTLMYFLADDTCEIREQYPLNCGRDNFPIFFRRGKVRKGNYEVAGPTHPVPDAAGFLKIEDFFVGARITLLNREFFVYDCDHFTRKYFADEFNVNLKDKIDVRLPERAVPRPATPEYTGYGSWDDSMASVLNLIPKAPRKDFHKLMYNDNKILRFTAKFANPKPEDVLRRFIFNFYLWDDCMAIHEPPQRNLGIITGKFLEKGVHLNQKTGRLFEPSDCLPGNIVQVFNSEFEMLEMDEYTRKYLTVPDSAGAIKYDLVSMLERIREAMRQQGPTVKEIFRRFDKDHNGVITVEEMKEACQKFSLQLSDGEVSAIMRHFDTHQDGQISYNEFCDALLDEDYPPVAKYAGAKAQRKLHLIPDQEYVDRTHSKTLQRSEVEKIRRAAREITDAFSKRAGLTNKLMKEFSAMTHQKTVTVEMVHAALLRLGLCFDLDDIERCVLFVLPGADPSEIPYFEFLQALNTTYHDLAATR